MEMTSSVLALIDTQRLPGRALRGPRWGLSTEGSRDPRDARPTHGHASAERRAPVRRQGQGRMHETVVYVPAFFLVVCSYVMCYFSPLTRAWSCV